MQGGRNPCGAGGYGGRRCAPPGGGEDAFGRVHSVEEAKEAVARGADYLGAGAVFSTATKTDVDQMPLEVLQDICRAVEVPVVAIGGIHLENMMELVGRGAKGVALVSAIFSAQDIEGECRRLRRMAEEMVSVVVS